MNGAGRERAARPPGGAYGWLMWALAATFYCYGFFQRVAPSVMVGELMADFGVTAAVLGNLSAFYFYAYAGLQLPVGVLIDNLGPRLMLALSAALCGLGSLLFAYADGLGVAYAGRLLIGAGAAFTWVGALKLASVWLPPRQFAMVTGMTLMLGMIGAVGGQAPLAGLVALAGWRGTLIGAAAFALALAAVIWLLVRDRPGAGDGSEIHDLAEIEAESVNLLHGLQRTILNRQSWIVALFGGCMTAPMLSFAGLWGVPYIMQAYGVARPAAAASTSLMLIGWGIGGPLAGWVSDRIGRRKAPMIAGSLVAVMTLSILIYMPGLTLETVRILLLANGFFSGVMVLCFAVGREQNPPKTAGASLGFVNTFVMAAGALFQPLIGWLLDVNWDGAMAGGARVYAAAAYQVAFLSLIGCGVVSLIAAISLRETHCRNVFEPKA